MTYFASTNRGFVRAIVLILIALLILAYFGLNLREIISSPTFQDNWNFLKGLIVDLWNNILKAPVTFIWNQVFVPLMAPVIQNATHTQ